MSTWSTPQSLFDKLDAEFNFTVDVCATEQNRKCGTYFSPEVNGLAQPWGTGRCWMNGLSGSPSGSQMVLRSTSSAIVQTSVVHRRYVVISSITLSA